MTIRDSHLHKGADNGDKARIRVLIVDDSLVVQSVFSRILSADDNIEIAATARNSDEALELLSDTHVDIILLDIEMPGRSGLEALPDLLAKSKGARILVVSSRAERNGAAAIKALELGACDTLVKPGKVRFAGGFSKQLIDKVVHLGQSEKLPMKAPPVVKEQVTKPIAGLAPAAIAIGASTGGIPAIYKFVAGLSDDISCPIFITQHLPATFMDFFAKQLAAQTQKTVCLAADGLKVSDNHIYVAPGGEHIGCERHADGQLYISNIKQSPDDHYCPSVGKMLTSLQSQYGGNVLPIMLSGMGNDGAEACKPIAAAGGNIFVQDQESCVVWGMPGAVIRLGIKASILPVEEMVAQLNKTGRQA